MQTRQEFAQVNGTRLYFEVAGEGLPLVLIHGFTLDSRMWDDQFAPLAEQYQVIRYDLRGFGKSAMPDDTPYTHADDLAALLNHLGVARAAILGLSAGGEVGIDFALAYPGMTRALIAVDAVIGGHHWSEDWDAWVVPVWQAARTAGIKAAKQRWLVGPIFIPAREQPAVATRLQTMVAEYSGWHWVNRDPQRRQNPPANERLAEITAPTLVLIGERDTADFHVMADHITGHIHGARRVTLPGVGHMASMEAPERFNAIVRAFLADLPRDAP